ncbi:MAG: ASKHA domain-containing protein, partial [Deferrisomatales bacterium]
GEELAAAGTANPQLAYGEDVVSRLAHAQRSPQGARELAAVLRGALDALAGDLAERAGVARRRIVDACLVGNTAIVHLLLELPVGPLAAAPFVSATTAPVDLKARELGLTLAPGAWAHLLPGVGGFVGADHVAMVLAAGLDRSPGAAVGIDIGTNTEIVVARPDRGVLLAASCASGPAFEGAHIRDGMRAAPGAVEAVRLTPAGPEVRTVGGAPALGLCGSGIVDAVAELRRTGAIDDRGHLGPDAPGVRSAPGGREFVLVPGDRTGHGRDVVVTQADVVEIQLAKAAIFAGIETLLEVAGLAAVDVAEVVVAGAFGSYLNLASAEAIGLVPRLAGARYVRAGNAAGEGAKLALVSGAERRRARELGRRLRHVELNDQPGFRRRLALALRFPGPGPLRP